MPTEEVVGSFSNEPDLDIEFDGVYSWRNWRVTKLDELKSKINIMDAKEVFSLQWLNTEDLYEALNPNFIERGGK